MNIRKRTTLLQFSDGLFPTGAYAHSFGLEWFVQAGMVNDGASLEALARSYLEASIAPADAVALLWCSKAARANQIEPCLRLDAALDALKPAEELRNASRQMGRQTLRIASSVMDHDLTLTFYRRVEGSSTPGHHATAWGLVSGALEWELEDAVSAYLYCSAAALVNSALRLFPLGQLAGQRVLWNLQPLFDRLVEEILGKREEDIWSFAPAMEIAAMRHAELDARLFRS